MIRPPILNKDGTLSDNVKFVIKDRSNNTVGVIYNDDTKMLIIFFDKVSPIIVYDKIEKKFDIDAEIFLADPKEIIRKLI